MINPDVNLSKHEYAQSPLAQAFTTLRINIDFLASDREIKTITVTSANREEGKSTTSLRLAVAYAKAGRKVILVDADLRKPSLHLPLTTHNECGLTNWLSHTNEMNETIQNTDIDNLSFIASGPLPPNPSELLASKQMDILLDELKRSYDIVVIDTPPIFGIVDAKILAAKSDGVVLVVEYGKVKRSVAKRVKDDLINAKANLLGVVINKINVKHAQPYPY